jgi:hypothetical protein
MKTKLLVVVAVTIFSVMAAVAIAGIPSSRASVPDIAPEPASVSIETTTTSTSPPQTTTTAEALEEETEAPTTAPDPTTTTNPTTTSTTTLAEELPIERGLVAVVVANGAAVSGVARETADQLAAFGYLDIRSTDGTEIVERSAIYAAPGLESEAERIALDLLIDPRQVFPLSLTPGLTVLPDGGLDSDLIVYLGVDVDNR